MSQELMSRELMSHELMSRELMSQELMSRERVTIVPVRVRSLTISSFFLFRRDDLFCFSIQRFSSRLKGEGHVGGALVGVRVTKH